MSGNGVHSRYSPIATGVGDDAMVVSASTVRQRGGGPVMGTPRRRAYSWKGESPPYEKLKSEDTSMYSVDKAKLMPKILQEARCVSVWLVLSGFIQVVVSILMRVASYAYPLKSLSPSNAAEPFCVWWIEWIMVLPSVISGCLLRIVPTQVVSNTAPGFIYASAWLLLGIKNRIGAVPHIPSRICEAVLGRLRPLECAILVAVQFVTTFCIVKVLRFLIQNDMPSTRMALNPIEYTSRTDGGGNPWIVDYFVELLINTLFIVSLQVVPVLLRLNHCPQWLTLVFVYPLYTTGVDRAGQGSTLSPSILFALGSMTSRQKTLHALFRCIPQLLAGVLAGNIMVACFPDESNNNRLK